MPIQPTRSHPRLSRATFLQRRPAAAFALVLAAAVLLLAGAAASCAINPATGGRQLSLIGQGQEVQMGRQADAEIVRSMGLVEQPALQEEVQRLGARLAGLSERPDLPWTFRVVDDPVVNAFALPGGYIYVTRGILAHFASEAELAAVLGHELGHVTARHSVNQISKMQLATLGLGVGALLEPELARFSDLTDMGMGLMFLKFGRDDERQADDLGLRYMTRAGYAPGAMVDVFGMLDEVSRGAGGGGVPGWLSTHPAPENRQERMREAIAAQGLSASQGTVNAERYLRLLDGMIYGENPRHGFFEGAAFYHPDMEFRLDFPDGWKTVNQASVVAGRSPGGEAILQLGLAEGADPVAAADTFFATAGIERGRPWRQEINGLRAISADFRAVSGQEVILGRAAFIAHGGKVFRLLGYAAADRWAGVEQSVSGALGSFRRLTDARILAVQPRRLEIVSVPGAMTLEEFNRRSPSTVPMDALAMLNRVSPSTRLPAGSLVKRVVGGP